MSVFDELHDRKTSPSIKWNPEFLLRKFGKDDLLPFWVADMDFKAPEKLIGRLRERAEQGFYGYEFRPDTIAELIAEWCYRRHEWEIDISDLTFAPSVLNALSVLIELRSGPGEGVIIQPPVYYPFEETILGAGRKPLYNRLIDEKNFYRMDFVGLEELASRDDAKIMIISSPHNPVGRVWTEEELRETARICRENDVLLISDEIHMEFVFDHQFFLTTAQLEPELRENTVQLFSAGKTFNLSGNTVGIAHFNDRELQGDFENFLKRFHLTGVNVFTTTALETVFSEGEEWFDDLLLYVEENMAYVERRIKKDLPKVRFYKPEGTYLVWLGFQDYRFRGRELEDLLLSKGGIALDPGRWFGEEYAAFARLNIGCSRELLAEALDRMASLFE